ncbi:MAG: cytochrome-c peroxidase [Gammaproteobacteria bacterium]|nr:MAG: cytochrome-c peroxidase [Gammaproteobacteria bacterium]
MPKYPRNTCFATAVIIFVSILTLWSCQNNNPYDWSADEIKILQSLSIRELPPLPNDRSNAVADNLSAAEFGRQLFFDERFSYNSKISCATCHIPEQYFTDGLVTAAGAQAGIRNTPTLVGTAYSPWQFWDGRSDSLWSQALAPLENSLEHAGSRNQFAHIIFADKNYREYYAELFGPMPDLSDMKRFPIMAAPTDSKELQNAWQAMNSEDQKTVNIVFSNIAKSIAAYQRLLQPAASRFDTYIEGVINKDSEKLKSLNKNEVMGLRLFIGKAQCINCHNGPLLTNNEFHNTGVLSAARQLPSLGRVNGVRVVLADPFNCQGNFSDAASSQCAHLRFVKTGDELIAAHKVPTLRNVADTAPYMHAGQLSTLEEVIEHYNQAPLAMIGHNEANPLELSKKERKRLTLFLHSLSAPLITDSKWLINPHK